MNKRITKLIVIVVLIFTVLSGCGAASSQEISIIKKPIKVCKIEEISRPIELAYMGTVAPESQVTYGFKSAGRLGEIFVKAGESVKKGDLLCVLDTSDLELQFNGALAQLSVSKENVKKASESYEYNKEMYENMKLIFESGGISEDQLDQIKLNLEISNGSLKQALDGVNASESQYNFSKNLIEDSKLVSEIDGTVLVTHFEVGELMGLGYPVVTLRSENSVIQVGISQNDKNLIKTNTKVNINCDDEIFYGEIVQINEMPDLSTRTYLTKIRVDNEKLQLGQIMEVNFNIGEENGIWISLDSVMSDGEKFVYVVNGDRAYKRIISIEDLFGYEVKVNGLEAGEMLVVEGMKNLTDGVNVQILE